MGVHPIKYIPLLYFFQRLVNIDTLPGNVEMTLNSNSNYAQRVVQPVPICTFIQE